MKKAIMFVVLGLIAGMPVWAQGTLKDKIYLKGAIGYGGGKNFSLFVPTTTGEIPKTSAGGGRNMEGALGYKISSISMVELGLGYQKGNEEPEISNGDAYFKRMPITLTYIYQILSKLPYRFYLGGGLGYYLLPELYMENRDTREELIGKYDSSFGFHGLGGVNYKLEGFYIFCEFKYVASVKYKLKEVTINDVKIDLKPEVHNEWKELDGSQWIFNVGIRSSF